MSKIKVCHICNMGINGKAMFVSNLLENTNFDKYDVTIINYRSGYVKSVISRLEKLPVEIVTPPNGTILDFIRFLNEFFRSNKFDICHTHMWDLSGPFLWVAHLRGIPIRVVHSHTTTKEKKRYGWLKTLLRDTLIWSIFRHMISINANRFAACSDEAACWLFPSSIIKNKKYIVVPNGIDITRFSCSNRKKHSPTHVLFTGRFLPEKNPLFAIRVFVEYLKHDHFAQMTMIGSGKMLDDIQKEINRFQIEEHVKIILETNNMPFFYHSADVLLFPSIYEGLGMTLIEAQASGLPCLASNTVPQIAQCGLIIYKPLSDGPEAWADSMVSLLSFIGKAADRQKLAFFDVKNTVKIVDELYGL